MRATVTLRPAASSPSRTRAEALPGDPGVPREGAAEGAAKERDDMTEKQIVVLGAGYAGLTAATRAARAAG